jgi:transposase
MAGDRPYRHALRFPGLALKVQEVLKRDPLSGHLSVFRGRRGVLIKVMKTVE